MNALFESSISDLPLISRGKVRDIYDVDEEHMLIVTTDRLSAFDVIMSQPIPGKGEVLTRVANFWFGRTHDLIPNHLSAIHIEDVVTDAHTPELRNLDPAVRRHRIAEAVTTNNRAGMHDAALADGYGAHQRGVGVQARAVANLTVRAHVGTGSDIDVGAKRRVIVNKRIRGDVRGSVDDSGFGHMRGGMHAGLVPCWRRNRRGHARIRGVGISGNQACRRAFG